MTYLKAAAVATVAFNIVWGNFFSAVASLFA